VKQYSLQYTDDGSDWSGLENGSFLYVVIRIR